jgi:CRISPR/Cas system-associated endonuclease/helicase Cas3
MKKSIKLQPMTSPPPLNEGKAFAQKKKTERKAIVRLELSNDLHQQLETIATGLYDMEAPPLQVAKNSQHWATVDDAIYKVAKRSYDDILLAFLKNPKLYRFESTREKIWADIDMAVKLKREREIDEEITKSKSNAGKKKLREKKLAAQLKNEAKLLDQTETQAESLDTLLETYLDPFDLPYPWRKEVTKGGLVTYYNPQTDHRVAERPAEQVC